MTGLLTRPRQQSLLPRPGSPGGREFLPEVQQKVRFGILKRAFLVEAYLGDAVCNLFGHGRLAQSSTHPREDLDDLDDGVKEPAATQ